MNRTCHTIFALSMLGFYGIFFNKLAPDFMVHVGFSSAYSVRIATIFLAERVIC